MELSEFLNAIEQLSDPQGPSVIAFQGVSSLFLSRFFARAQGSFFESAPLNLDMLSFQEAKASLDICFLGKRLVYWIRGLDELSASSKKLWLTSLKAYEGPHCLVLLDSAAAFTSSKTCTLVTMPSAVSLPLYKQLSQFLYPHIQLDPTFTQALFQQGRALSLDKACMMLEYHTVVGRRSEEFFKEWYGKLVEEETSLFALSQSFFAQQPKLFFEQWNRCKEDYPHEFWIAYWSELLWQAALFVIRVHTKNHAEAKKAALKLPFSFINKDWQRYTFSFFVDAHNFLYDFEYRVKQGERSWGFELFFHKFLSGNFSSRLL